MHMTKDDEHDDSGFEVSPALAGSVALVVAALAAVGVSGDLLTRAVRNEPALMAATISLAVLLSAGAVAVSLWRKQRRSTAGVVLGLALTSAFAVMLGATSLDVRETPVVTTSVIATERGYDVTVNAQASGLRSDEDMLVQLQALRFFPTGRDDFVGPGGLEESCSASRLTSNPEATPDWPGPLLAWQQAGPNTAGEALVSFDVSIPKNRYKGLCAVAIYRNPRATWSGAWLNGLQSWLHLPTGEEPNVSNAIVRIQ